jgi:hypothetical protein
MKKVFNIGDMVFMNSPEWPYLNQTGKIIDHYFNGDGILIFVVKPLDNSRSSVGVSPDLCIDARPIIREQKLKELGI